MILSRVFLNMKVFYLLVYCSIIVIYTGSPTFAAIGFGFQTSDGIPQNIPPNLLECYNSTYITTKDNLLPMTVPTLIALVRKIEEVGGGNMDVRSMSSALITSYRYDGIQYKPQLDPQGIPYAVDSADFSLWKLLYDKVIAKTGFSVPNDTLTWVERCTLHRMLSMSIDPYERGDEGKSCSKLDNLINRYPRDVSKLSDVEIIPTKVNGESRIMNDPMDEQQTGNFMQFLSGSDGTISSCPIENGVIRDQYSGAITPGIVLAGIAAGSQPQFVPQRNLYMMPRDGNFLKRKNTQNAPGYPNNPNFNPNVNAFGNVPRNQQGRTFVASQFGSSGMNPYGGSGGGGSNPNYGGGGSNPNYGGGSSNPSGGRGIGNGYPNYGGNSQGKDDLPIPSSIDNKHASTLAGEIADVSVWMGQYREGVQIGLSGGWNDTVVPKYYFIKDLPLEISLKALTDARIRGAIDGLLLGVNMENYINAVRGSGLKLSQILSMYYSTKGVFSSDVKSCNRRAYYEQIAPINVIKDQTYAAAYVLSDLGPYVPMNLPDITNKAAEYVRSYVPTLQDPSCPLDSTSNPKPAPVIDLYMVVDYNWDYTKIYPMVQYIIDHLEIWKYGGNFTLINGKDTSAIVESSHSPLDLGQNFTNYQYGNGGFDFTKILSSLKERFQDKLEFDKLQNSGGGIPRIVIFMPYALRAMSDSETRSAKSRIHYFRENLPDVKFYYLVYGSKNSVSSFTDNPDKDIFVASSDISTSLDPLINALTTTPRRIIDPNCGKYFKGSWYNEVTLNGYLDSGEIHYYKVHPNYFFKGANAKISVSTEGNSPVLTVCQSRDNPNPIANLSRSGAVSCQTITSGNRYEMRIAESDCKSVYYAIDCKPFYFSIANLQAPNKGQISTSCTDQECRDPDMSKYTIRHSGLSCYSSVTKLVTSSPMFLIALLIHFSKII